MDARSKYVSLYVRCVECRSRICMTVLIMSQPSNRISKNEDGAHLHLANSLAYEIITSVILIYRS